jgi:hypothetical protein
VTISGLVDIELTSDERHLLRSGLLEWGGPASATDELARPMGFLGKDDLLRGDGDRLRQAIDRGEPLTRHDWRRTLLATEIVFASDVVGSGWDWSITTGLADDLSIKLLRAVQRKVVRVQRLS